MGLCLSALSECLERIWRVFGEKMREIREFIGRICDFPDIDRDQLVFWSRSTCLLDGAWRIFRVWSRSISDSDRDPLKKISPLTLLDREQELWRLAILWKFQLSDLHLIASNINERSRSFEKFQLSDLMLIASNNRADRDQTTPKSPKLLFFNSRTPGLFQNDLFIFPKTSFHDFHGLYIKS